MARRAYIVEQIQNIHGRGNIRIEREGGGGEAVAVNPRGFDLGIGDRVVIEQETTGPGIKGVKHKNIIIEVLED